MKFKIFLATICLTVSTISFGQSIKRIDGSEITTDSLNAKIEYLMKVANISGVAVSVFSDNKQIFSKTYGFANVQKNIPFEKSSVMYGASFSKRDMMTVGDTIQFVFLTKKLQL